MEPPRKTPTQIALLALEKIEQHEKECGMRWKEACLNMELIVEQVNNHAKRWEKMAWLIVGAVVVGAVTITINNQF